MRKTFRQSALALMFLAAQCLRPHQHSRDIVTFMLDPLPWWLRL